MVIRMSTLWPQGVLAADQIGTAERLPVGYAVLVIVVLILLLWAILLILLWGSSRTEGLSNIRRWLPTRPLGDPQRARLAAASVLATSLLDRPSQTWPKSQRFLSSIVRRCCRGSQGTVNEC
jgi:hypothetical protein